MGGLETQMEGFETEMTGLGTKVTGLEKSFETKMALLEKKMTD